MISTGTHGWLGIDIGASTIKLAQVSRHQGRFCLTEAAVAERSRPWHESSMAHQVPRPSADEIAGALSLGTRFRGRNAAVVAPHSVCEILSMYLPEIVDSRLGEQVARQLRLAGTPVDHGVSLDFWRTSHPSDRTEAVDNVGAMTIRDAWADQLVDDVGSAGLRCQALDGVPISLTRMMKHHAGHDATAPTAVLDWGYSRALLCVVFGGRPIYSRCLKHCGYHRLLEHARRSANLTHEETLQLLREHGLPLSHVATPQQKIVAEVAAASLEALESELRRTFAHLGSHRAHIVPNTLCLVGAGATVRNIAEYLSSRAPCEVRQWDPSRALSLQHDSHRDLLPLLGPTIAMSMLAWEDQ